jgi:undecaprenyl-diphosphatase
MRAGDHQRTGFVFAVRWISGLFIALVVARFMQNLVPSHLRPISEPGLGLTAYKTSDMAYFARLYSFPSDHAIMFFGLATAIFTRSRRIGVCAFLWAAFIICLPRVYFGYHYPSDIFAGAILGVAIMGAALKARIPQYAVEGAHGLDQRAPGLAYAIAFLVSAEIAVNFDHVREVIVALGKATAG